MMAVSGEAPLLLVEDNPRDVLLFQHAMQKAQLAHPVQVVVDGEAAVEYLEGTGKYADREAFPLPAVMLLDLRLPRRSGFDVLQWLRERPGGLRRLPVVVFTSSSTPNDIDQAYDLGANSYLVKPVQHQELVSILALVAPYWLARNQPPRLT